MAINKFCRLWKRLFFVSVSCALFEGSEIILCLLVQSCLLVTVMKTFIYLTHTQGRCLTLKRLSDIL